MSQDRRDWESKLEESAQGTDRYEAPDGDRLIERAREEAREFAGGDISAGGGSSPRVEKARQRRHDLRSALTDLEHTLSGPSGAPGFLGRVEEGLVELRKALEEHIEVTEGPTGLLHEIGEVAPRLSNEIALIGAEHVKLEEALAQAEAASARPDHPRSVRLRVMDLLTQLSLHRQRGADLVYEAYNVDIAAGD